MMCIHCLQQHSLAVVGVGLPYIRCPSCANCTAENVKEPREERKEEYEVHTPPYQWALSGGFLYKIGQSATSDLSDSYYHHKYDVTALTPDCGKLIRRLHRNELEESNLAVSSDHVLNKCKILSDQPSGVAPAALKEVIQGKNDCALTAVATEGLMFRTICKENMDSRRRVAFVETWICCMLRLMDAKKVREAVGEVHARMICCVKMADLVAGLDTKKRGSYDWEEAITFLLEEFTEMVMPTLRAMCVVSLFKVIPVQHGWQLDGHRGTRSDSYIAELIERLDGKMN
jgi:hypothetical protein